MNESIILVQHAWQPERLHLRDLMHLCVCLEVCKREIDDKIKQLTKDNANYLLNIDIVEQLAPKVLFVLRLFDYLCNNEFTIK